MAKTNASITESDSDDTLTHFCTENTLQAKNHIDLCVAAGKSCYYLLYIHPVVPAAVAQR